MKFFKKITAAICIFLGSVMIGCTEEPAPIAVTSVTLDSTSMTLSEGENQKLTVTVSPSNAENKTVIWTSSNSSVASVKEGLVTAVKSGSATITVKSDDGGKTATCAVTVNAKVYPVEDILLDKTSHEMTEGDTFTLTATVKPDNATNKNVTWSSSDSSVATVSNSKVIAKKAGTATITVKAEDGGKTATCEVTVNAKVYPVESISLDKTSFEMTEGDTFTLTATVKPDNATNKNVTWSSSDSSVATVSNGKVIAKKAGTATITIKTEDGGKTATCEVTVNAKVYPVESVSLDKTLFEMTEGDTFTLTATVKPDNATNKNVIWSSSNNSVASVSNGKVTALKDGKATITVKTEDGSKTATCEVTVNAKVYPVESVSLDKTSFEMTEGDEFTLTATVKPNNATNKNVTWNSSNTSVATVDNGKVTALNMGKTIITIKTEDGGKTATCEVTVKSQIIPVSAVILSSTSLTLYEGSKTILTTQVLPANATNPKVTWHSDAPAIAHVDQNGEITAISEGYTEITATADGISQKCIVTVLSSSADDTTDYIDEYGINHGPGIEIDGVVWAPVNCGYHKTNYQYGKLFQWGRKYGQGYQNGDYWDSSAKQNKEGGVSVATGNDEKNQNYFYQSHEQRYSDWASPQDNSLWNNGTESDPIKTIYDPCPMGWRIPTATELKALSSQTAKEEYSAFNLHGILVFDNDSEMQLFIPYAGYIGTGGMELLRGDAGFYWSSSPDNNKAFKLCIYSVNFRIVDGNHARGAACSVRCVKE